MRLRSPRTSQPLGLWIQGLLRSSLLGGMAILAACSTPPVEPEFADPFEATTEVGMKVLRARLYTEQLESAWRIEVGEGPHEFGSMVDATLVLPNPFGRPFELIEPVQGYVVEMDWKIERWMPYAGAEMLSHRQLGMLDRLLEMEPGDEVREAIPLPLGSSSEPAALWRIQIDAAIRVDGIRIDDEELPVSRIALKGVRLLATPPNWEQLAEDPLGKLKKLALIPDKEADRHVVVAAALVPREQRRDAIDQLIADFNRAPNLRRLDTMMAALRYLTGLDFQENPVRWREWWEDRKMSAS